MRSGADETGGICPVRTGQLQNAHAAARGCHDVAMDPATHSQRGIIWRIHGEVPQSITYPQVRRHMTAVCKTVGFACQARTRDLSDQRKQPLHKPRQDEELLPCRPRCVRWSPAVYGWPGRIRGEPRLCSVPPRWQKAAPSC